MTAGPLATGRDDQVAGAFRAAGQARQVGRNARCCDGIADARTGFSFWSLAADRGMAEPVPADP